MARLLHHGNKDLYMAVATSTTFQTPQRCEGLISAELENESESEIFYADDIAYATLRGAKSRKLTLKVAQINNFMAKACMGVEWDENTMGTTTGAKSKLAIYWCENAVDVDTGSTTRRLHILYNCVLNGQPKLETETDEDKAKVSEIELEFVCSSNEAVIDKNGNTVDYVTVLESERTKPIFDKLATKVYTPNNI